MIHIYHGNGKGKTTAAMGLALRALGVGYRVVIVQFLKGGKSGEIEMLCQLPNVTILRGKNSTKFSFQMNEDEKKAATALHDDHLEQATAWIERGECDLLILDEILDALATGLLDEKRLRTLLANRPDEWELVFTGRNPPAFLRDAADYITEMRCEKHPYERGIAARKGIEF